MREREKGCGSGGRGGCHHEHRQVHQNKPRRHTRGFFLGLVSVALASAAMATYFVTATAEPSAVPGGWVCQYEQGTYSVGAIVHMGRIEKVCSVVDGLPRWVRS